MTDCTKCWLCNNRYPSRLIKHTVITWIPGEPRKMERWMMFCQVCWGLWP